MTVLDTTALLLIAVTLVTIDWRFRRMAGELRRLAPGCTCPLEGRPSSSCPAHRQHGPRGVEPTWFPPVPPARPAAPPPDSTDAFYVPPGRGE